MLPITEWMSGVQAYPGAPVGQHGPYLVREVPGCPGSTAPWGYVVSYFEEDEPRQHEGVELAWAAVECAVPAIADTSLVGAMHHRKDGKTLVLELYAA